MIESHLAQALGERHIARQVEIVAELERDGHEQTAIAARELLVTFEQTQSLTVEDRDRLRAELAALS